MSGSPTTDRPAPPRLAARLLALAEAHAILIGAAAMVVISAVRLSMG